jgi:apolipoprotein D and lipocalin family protein
MKYLQIFKNNYVQNLSLAKVGICVILLLGIIGCVTKPDKIKPVTNFEAQKYVGKWYEVARLDNSFEKDMTHVYAEYSLNPNGSIKVVNSGVKNPTGKRVYAKGVAKFVQHNRIGYLKVSFFRPFYSPYIVFQLGDAYEYAYVAGNKKQYLWLLARTKSVPESVKQDFVKKAKELGFDTEKLIWVHQQSEEAR